MDWISFIEGFAFGLLAAYTIDGLVFRKLREELARESCSCKAKSDGAGDEPDGTEDVPDTPGARSRSRGTYRKLARSHAARCSKSVE